MSEISSVLMSSEHPNWHQWVTAEPTVTNARAEKSGSRETLQVHHDG